MSSPADFVECWAFGHSMHTVPEPDGWEMPDSLLWVGARHIIHRRCSACGVYRAFAMNYRGRPLRSKYWHYADGYLAPPGSGRREKAKARLMVAGAA
jgi:hypothetical protein